MSTMNHDPLPSTPLLILIHHVCASSSSAASVLHFTPCIPHTHMMTHVPYSTLPFSFSTETKLDDGSDNFTPSTWSITAPPNPATSLNFNLTSHRNGCDRHHNKHLSRYVDRGRHRSSFNQMCCDDVFFFFLILLLWMATTFSIMMNLEPAKFLLQQQIRVHLLPLRVSGTDRSASSAPLSTCTQQWPVHPPSHRDLST